MKKNEYTNVVSPFWSPFWAQEQNFQKIRLFLGLHRINLIQSWPTVDRQNYTFALGTDVLPTHRNERGTLAMEHPVGMYMLVPSNQPYLNIQR